MAAIIALLVWLPLQTPVAIVAYQYFHIGPDAARAILLIKDVGCAVLLGFLLVAFGAQIRLRWFDALALIYVLLIVAYSVIPILAGTTLPVAAIAASAREFAFPVELYAIGRLAGIALPEGDTRRIVVMFLLAAGVWAVATLGLYWLLPANFWATTLDLVTFERVVQGLPNAKTLWDIGLLGQYGVGDAAQFARAVGPFTHPVGTAHYFLVPLLLAVAGTLGGTTGRLRIVGLAALSVLLGAAVVAPISRAAWIGAFVGVLICGFLYRRMRPALGALILAGGFIALVPPFSYSVASAIQGTDSSVAGHQQAIDKGVNTAASNPLGLGVGQADQFGAALSTGPDAETAAAAIGENMYLSVLVSVGPFGLAAFLGWLAGLVIALYPGRHPPRSAWLQVGIFCVLIGLLVASMTASPLMRFTTAASFWMLAGLLVPVSTRAPGLGTGPGPILRGQ